MSNFSINLTNEMNNKKVKQKELATFLNVTQPTISRYMQGLREPTIEQLIKLANYFDCTIDYLVGRTDY